jgi:hypothetical protein
LFEHRPTLPVGYKEKVLKKMMRDILYTFVDNLIDNPDFYNLISVTTDAMKADLAVGKSNEFIKEDIKTVEEQLTKEAEHNTQLITGIFLAPIVVFAKREPSEIEIGRLLAYLSDKVFLSDNGDIVKVQLRQLGDYIFQCFKKEIPYYTEPFR